MICDLRGILDGWEYEPGKISVRKIIGRDGREKVQTRIDLGVLQFELKGRPDGARPHGYESLLDRHEKHLIAHLEEYGTDADFVLTPEQCRDLRHEAYLYYQRYLSLFVLEEFEVVADDTARNLRAIDFCRRYGASEYDRDVLESQRAYVIMMNARARATHALEHEAYDAALSIIKSGIVGIRKAMGASDEGFDADQDREVEVLHELRDEILEKMPDETLTKLRWALENAVACEDFERAAELRDRLERRSSPAEGPRPD